MHKLLVVLLSLTLFGVIMSGCGEKQQQADNGKMNIVSTIFPEYDFARAVAGDNANLFMMTPPGASVHSFDPSPSDIVRVQNADVFIYVGGESEVWVDNILESIDKSNMKIIRLMDAVDTMQEEIKDGMQEDEHDEHTDADGHDEESGERELDEHIWTSPKNAIKLIDVICDGICEKDSQNTEIYKANAKKYQDEIKKVDNDITDIVNTAKRHKIIVADKFPFLYFVKAYGLEYEAAFPGCSDQADAGAKTIAHLVNAVKDEKIPYVYYVELSNKSVATAISEQTGAEMLLLNSCHNLSKTDFEAGATYLDLMKQNVENLRKGLN